MAIAHRSTSVGVCSGAQRLQAPTPGLAHSLPLRAQQQQWRSPVLKSCPKQLPTRVVQQAPLQRLAPCRAAAAAGSPDDGQPLVGGVNAEQAGNMALWVTAFSLTKAVLGAGMTAIPRAYFLMGSLAGTAMIVVVGLLTYWTKAVLVDGSAATNTHTYSALTEATCGKVAAKALQLAVLGMCSGFMVIFLVVIGDILAGSSAGGAASGLLYEITGSSTGLLANRKAVIAAVATLIMAPMCALRSMEKLAGFNIIGVAAVTLLAISTVALGGAAFASGQAHVVPLLPQWSAFGDTPLRIATGFACVAPVVLNCYVAHQSVHAVSQILRPYSAARMRVVVLLAMLLSAFVFFSLAIGGGMAFGAGLDVNVLTNMSTAGMAGLVGPHAAQLINLTVRGGFLVSLIGSFVNFMFPLRSTVSELIWGGGDKAEALEAQFFVPLTYGLLASVLACAVVVPNIWAALSFVGNIATTMAAFIIPAMIALSLGDRLNPGASAGQRAANKAVAYVVLVLGVALFGNGVLQQFLV